MTMTKSVSALLHLGAVALMALGLLAWDAEGAALWRDAVFSFCL